MPNDSEFITQETDTETTENVEVVEEQEQPEEEAESIEELRRRLATAEAQKEHWRNKANSTKTAEPTGSLSSSDLLAVMNAKVHEDDMERVERFAKSEGVSIKEALKNPELKAILSIREEQRSTAVAANVTNVRRGSVKISDDSLIANANAGKLPDDTDGIERLIAAKLKRK